MSQNATLRKYGESATLCFDLFQPDGVDLEVGATFAAGDIKIMKDEGAEANTTNLPTDEGQTYSIVLTATEMQAARIKIIIVDQTATKVWLDTTINIETYGNASAQHAFDLDTALDVPTATENADALLNRDMSAVSDTNDRSPLNALRFLRNYWYTSGTTRTVRKEDDSTVAWTATLTASATADTITGSDPD